MKKSAKKIMSLILIATFIFSEVSTAYAAHSGYEANAESETTPYGELTGVLYVYTATHTGKDLEITACTELGGGTTMLRTTTKMECVDSETGESIDWDLDRYPQSKTERNTNHCDLRHYHYVTDPITVFTTHEVSYSSSYVVYMTTDVESL